MVTKVTVSLVNVVTSVGLVTKLFFAGSDGHTLALTKDGCVYSWGDGKCQNCFYFPPIEWFQQTFTVTQPFYKLPLRFV